MSEFLAKNLLGNMPLVPTNKLFKSPLMLFFECCEIARAVPIEINETKVHLDFHIYAILEFDILISHPLLNLIQEKSFDGGLDNNMGKTAFATHTSCPVSPMAKPHLTHDPFEEAKFVSPLFHLSLLVKPNVHHRPRSNLSNVPLAIQTSFSMMVEIQR
jgi:hypothetical protein